MNLIEAGLNKRGISWLTEMGKKKKGRLALGRTCLGTKQCDKDQSLSFASLGYLWLLRGEAR